jgi:hypothetical protein
LKSIGKYHEAKGLLNKISPSDNIHVLEPPRQLKEVPDYTVTSARSRVKAVTKQRNRVLQAIYSGRPLDAEPDQVRKLQRLQKVAGVSI